MALSSFCRACGEHFKIEKGEAVPPTGLRVSGIVLPLPDEEPNSPPPLSGVQRRATPLTDILTPKSGLSRSWFESVRSRRFDPQRDAISAPIRKTGPDETVERALPAPAAEVVLKPVEPDRADATADDADGAPGAVDLGRDSQPVDVLRQGSMSAMFGGVIERLAADSANPGEFSPKMPPTFTPADGRKKGGPQTRIVRCFDCNHLQSVSLAATSTQCARCSIYISLIDHEINSAWSQNIRTRGTVRIRRRGSVTGCDIACDNLEVDGKMAASVDCSGDAVFRNDARIMGNMHCRHLHVEKRCEVAFPQGVVAETADIYGTLVGNLTCAGTVRIFKSGKVEGNAIARSIDLKDGGVLSGRMSIQPNIDITLPEKKGYLKMD